jgi:D-3-phosphoglycerate dehydrogenase / 2-oxoglutarate reductase
MKALITTVPFAEKNQLPIEMLESSGIEYVINPLGRKLKENELAELIVDYDILIAGTEPITKNVLNNANKLKIICRVGIGLDNTDLNAAKNKGIKVCYTPEAPSPAVAELTIGLMISLLRSIHLSNMEMHDGKWKRYFGKRISEITIGVIGVGRIGGRVIRRLVPFGTPRILVNDVIKNDNACSNYKLEWVDKEYIYREADLITLHLPLNMDTNNMINNSVLELMKESAYLINTSRGGILNEKDLYNALRNNIIAGAAIDVFKDEPYNGKLKELDNCILTSHMGSMSIDCRSRMEIEAVEAAVAFANNKTIPNIVPKFEYKTQELLYG